MGTRGNAVVMPIHRLGTAQLYMQIGNAREEGEQANYARDERQPR